MRNLFLLREERRNIVRDEIKDTIVSEEIIHFCKDHAQGIGYILECNQSLLLACESEEGEILWSSCLLHGEKRQWIASFYIGETNCVLCVAKEGELVSVDCESQVVDLVGVIDSGILAASQSPDEELLIFVTGMDKIVCMTPNFEVLNEVNLAQGLRQETPEVTVSWRGDGQYFAILANEQLTTEEEDSRRQLRVYDRDELVLHSLGRMENNAPVGGLGRPVAWSNDGSLIAAVQTIKEKTQVVFFESNGLRHREFLLRDLALGEVVEFLSWNVDNAILAVGIRGKEDTSRLQLWHRNNYHWYMKYEVCVPTSNRISLVRFDAEKPNQLHMILQQSETKAMEWRTLDLAWDVTVSQTALRTAVVVDGRDLLLTPLGRCVIPPPMYACKVTLPAPVTALATFSSYIACLTSDGVVHVYDEQAIVSAGEGQVKALCSLPVLERSDQLVRQIGIIAEQPSTEGELNVILLAVVWKGTQHLDSLVQITCSCTSREDTTETYLEMSGKKSFDLEDQQRVIRLQTCRGRKGDGYALVGINDRKVLKYEFQGGGLVQQEFYQQLEPCPWLRLLEFGQGEEGLAAAHEQENERQQQSAVVGLSERSRLYFGEHLICGAVSSFMLSYTFGMLIYVTLGSRPELRFIPFRELQALDVMSGAEAGIIQSPLEPRALERGARLVTSLISSPSVIVQVPRGNLETIYPRAFVLHSVGRMLQKCRYDQAFSLMRRHNVDMNFLVDYDPSGFEQEVEIFVEQVQRPDHLNIFVSALDANDCTEGLRACLETEALSPVQNATAPYWFPAEKRNRVCELVRHALLRIQEGQGHQKLDLVESILTTLARQSPPHFEEALIIIKEEIQEKRKEKLWSESSQRLIRYLAFFTDINDLYDTALGLYDLDLARAVGRLSQKDPREYLPALDKLQVMESWKSKVAIDLQLKRPESALGHMAQRAEAELDVDDICDIVIASCLHEKAINLFKRHRFPRLYERLMYLYADNLNQEGHHKKAMYVYLAMDSTNPDILLKAAQAARTEGDWRNALIFISQAEHAQKDGYDSSEIISLSHWAKQFVHSFLGTVGEGREEKLKDAAVIQLDYLQDIEGAVTTLVNAASWSEALRIAWKAEREDLVESIKIALIDSADDLIEDLHERPAKYETLEARLYEVLEKIKKQLEEEAEVAFKENDLHKGQDSSSLFSAATDLSMMSSYSVRSSSSATSSSCHSRLTWSPSEMNGGRGNTSTSSPISMGAKKGRKGRIPKKKLSYRDEETRLRSELLELIPNEHFLTLISDLSEHLLLFDLKDYAKQVIKNLEIFVKFIESHPFPAVFQNEKNATNHVQAEKIESNQEMVSIEKIKSLLESFFFIE